MPDHVTRIGVSLEPDLLEAFDKFVDKAEYKSRSEALRDLVRDALVKEKQAADEEVIGALMVLYDHDAVHTGGRFTEVQHEAQHSGDIAVTATLHIHVDHRHCMEVIILRGRARTIQRFSEELRALKGIKHGQLSLTAIPPG